MQIIVVFMFFAAAAAEEEVEMVKSQRFDALQSAFDKFIYHTGLYPTALGNQSTNINVGFHLQHLQELNTNGYTVIGFILLSWQDHRLIEIMDHVFHRSSSNKTFEKEVGLLSTMRFSDEYKKLVWQPPIYFLNAESASIEDAIATNELIQMFQYPTITYLARIKIRLTCRMQLKKYPFDEQTCPMEIGILAYQDKQVKLSWTTGPALFESISKVLPDFNATPVNRRALVLDEYYLTDWNYGETVTQYLPGVNTTVLGFHLKLERRYAFYLLQYYLPTICIVIISWCSYWLDLSAVPARVSLCITTILTLQTLSAGLTKSLPPVSYFKAIDIWIVVCQSFVFFALLEFIFAHQLIKSGKTKCQKLETNDEGTDEKPKVKINKLIIDEVHSLAAKIDGYCRIAVIPIFVIFNIIYWIVYLVI